MHLLSDRVAAGTGPAPTEPGVARVRPYRALAVALVLGALAAVAAVAGVVAAPPAGAHTYLLESEPVDRAEVDEVPERVTFRFDQQVRPASDTSVRVVAADGEAVDTGLVVGLPTEVSVGLLDDLPAGTYVATYLVIMEDSHLMRGGVTFTVTAGAAPPPRAERAGSATGPDLVPAAGQETGALLAAYRADPLVERAATAARALVYLGTLLAAGGALFLVVVLGSGRAPSVRRPSTLSAAAAPALLERAPGTHDGPRRLSVSVPAPVDVVPSGSLPTVVVVAAVAGAVATVAGLVLHAAQVSDLGLGVVASPVLVADLAGADLLRSTVVRVAALLVTAVAVVAWRRASTWAGPVALVAAAGAVASFALTGHTASSQPWWLVVPASLAHTVAAAVWFGGLVLLALVLRRPATGEDPVAAGAAVARFSAVTTVAVVIVAVAGLALSWVELGGLRGLATTPYGQVLLAKVAVVAAVGAVGLVNHRRLVPALRDRPTAAAAARLRHTVRLEALGLVVAIVLTGVLVNLLPPRSSPPDVPVEAPVVVRPGLSAAIPS
ncbi:MAG TPA: CopD family protein [Acidimicrobiales bacterium]|nr:CopD family protein [Acidimicrobiales bacterium]